MGLSLPLAHWFRFAQLPAQLVKACTSCEGLRVAVDDWKVSEQDTHLSSAANDEAMRRLALEMLPRLTAPARRPQ